MPKLIPDEQWRELIGLADGLLARAREIGLAQGGDAAASDDLAIVISECQALNLATMALSQACPLAAAEMFIGMGGAMGVVLAQQTDSHPTLLAAFRAQMRSTYNEISEAHAPKGSC